MDLRGPIQIQLQNAITIKKIFLSIVFITLALVSNAKATDVNKAKTQSFIAGGVSIKIPIPDITFVEVGNDNRVLMDVIVPQNNRLLCAFVLTNDLPRLFKDGNSNIISKYAMVQVPRRGENMDCEVSDFAQVVDGAKESFSDATPIAKLSEEEFNRRIKSLDISNLQVKLGQPTQLGIFFSKQDIIGLGMLMGYEMGGITIKMGMTIILMRVKKRLLFIYLYAEYKNDETIKWLHNIGEKWSDEILKANLYTYRR